MLKGISTSREGDIHRKKRFPSFPSPAGMSLTKLPLGKNNSVMTSLFPPRESLVVTSRLGTGNSRTFFYGVEARRGWSKVGAVEKGRMGRRRKVWTSEEVLKGDAERREGI